MAGIAELTATGGGDAPEPSIGATIRAIQASEPGSSVFVYTDASASDTDRFPEAMSLILEKNIVVNFIIENSFIGKRSVENQQQYEHQPHTKWLARTKRQIGIDVYQQIAELSGGQVLTVDTNEISELASLVSFSAIRSRRTIFRRSSVLVGSVNHSFPVDSSIIGIMISISGQSITASVTTPLG